MRQNLRSFAIPCQTDLSVASINFGKSQCRTFAKVSALSLAAKKRKGKKISMVTAYDSPSAVHVSRADIDIILVGDSLGMVELGYETTQPVTMQQMLHHCSAVKRGVEQSGVDNCPLLVGDMPFGSYEFEDTDAALRHAYQFVKEAGMDAVKLEVRSLSSKNLEDARRKIAIKTYSLACCFFALQGGSEARARTAKRIVDGGGKTVVECQFVSISRLFYIARKNLTYKLASFILQPSGGHGPHWIDAPSH